MNKLGWQLRYFGFLAALILVSLLLQWPQKAYAHFPASAGSLTAILHVEPDDYPAAAQPETIYFIFSDSAKHFQLSKCTCDLTISYQNQGLYFSHLDPPPSGQTSIYSTKGIAFVFPNQGVYNLRLSGRPTTNASFQPFNLSWNFRVTPALSHGHDFSTKTFLTYFGVILGALLVIGLLVFVLS